MGTSVLTQARARNLGSVLDCAFDSEPVPFLRLSPPSKVRSVAGVRYRSARHEGGTCVVLFFPTTIA